MHGRTALLPKGMKVLAAVGMLAFWGGEIAAAAEIHNITLVKRVLYGPGTLPDQELAAGHVHNMEFHSFMSARVPGANNGGEPPNVSGEALQGTPVDGRMSDGTLINENIDMGVATIMNGQFTLLLGAVHGGPHHGDSSFRLDGELNWTIDDDIAIDPGIPEATIHIDRFHFTTGPRRVPPSIQTGKGYPGGVDRVGSLRSGEMIVGRLGDDDMDGFVDCVFLAIGHFPLSSVVLPGAPFVQTLEVKSDIPIDALDAALLSAAAARNSLRALEAERDLDDASGERLRTAVRERLGLAVRHIDRAEAGCASNCGEIRHFAQIARTAAGLAERSSPEALGGTRRLTEVLLRSHRSRHPRHGGRREAEEAPELQPR